MSITAVPLRPKESLRLFYVASTVVYGAVQLSIFVE